MKKLCAIFLTMGMLLSLAACGGVDTTSAVDAFNATSERMGEVGEIANPNAAMLGDEFMDEMIAVAEDLGALKSELESEDITQERADEIEAISNEYLATIDDFEQKIEDMLSDPTLAKIQTITDIIINIIDEYNEVVTLAVENGWEADDMTVEELNAMVSFLDMAQTDGFFDDVAALDEAQLDELLEQCEMLQGAMPEILERVSQPYTDEK